MRAPRVAIVGAGIGGLAAGVLLAARGLDVVIFERAPNPGGKVRETQIGATRIDAGPTVFTMRWVFETIFAEAGASLSDHISLTPLDVVARHAWRPGVAGGAPDRLDLFADFERSVDAIGRFAGAAEARGYRAFCATARLLYDALRDTYIASARPSITRFIKDIGWRRVPAVLATRPYAAMAGEIARHFRDPRLRQLFGRYATYCGSAPESAPATLNLISHVESEGVWSVDGGMHRLVEALAGLAERHGARIRCNCHVSEVVTAGGAAAGVRLETGETIAADAVIVNADVHALASGLLGAAARASVPPVPPAARSLSALTWAFTARTGGFPLARHSVFFDAPPATEFDDIFRHGRLPRAPTVYVCAQDRLQDRSDKSGGDQAELPVGPERLLVIVNAPANGDTTPTDSTEIERCERSTFALLEACGLRVDRSPAATVITAPAGFANRYPATGGALYGRASHGWMASFQRPGSRSKIPRLYLAGGSTHPGPGVPMAALSGRQAALSLILDLASIHRSHPAAMPGGMSTASPTMANTASPSSASSAASSPPITPGPGAPTLMTIAR